MNLADERLKELDNPSLTADERSRLRCGVAADLIGVGQYDAAREVLGELWRGVGVRPEVSGMEKLTAAEVLLQVGALSGWLGASGQVAGAQDKAKDLISESVALFESLGELNRAAVASSDLALCYWREGAYNETRLILEGAASRVGDDDELKAKIILRLAVVGTCAGRSNDALRLLKESAPFFERSTNHALRGKFHNELAIILMKLGMAENRADYFDSAIIEYTAAIYHYEQAGHERYKATNENNLAFLLYKLGRYGDAHAHLDRARRTLVRLNDAGLLAQVDETRARVFIAEKKYDEAERVIAGAVKALEKGGESGLLADALAVQGLARARLGAYESSLNILRQAVRVADESGAASNAGLAALTLIEEHGTRSILPAEACYNVYRRADKLLKDTQDAEDIARLRACARVVMRRLVGARLRDKNFTLPRAVHELEAKFIEQALEEEKGSVSRAARKLGIAHQTLIALLDGRHKELLPKRTPARKRPRSIVKKG
ncbi:MAG TPA: helix-turn-helix domain-containing protein [Pyrinomonadaceae bacterium]|nr:helix-turn-helix domain-containing protein [Pyrinomonadaceae bacterium]